MPDAADIEMLAAALKRAGDGESSFQHYEHTYWTNVAAKILADGYVVVKLPDMVVDQDGFKTWAAPQEHDTGIVRIRRTDGQIYFTSVFTPFESPEHALSLAAALIAAAQYVQEQTDV